VDQTSRVWINPDETDGGFDELVDRAECDRGWRDKIQMSERMASFIGRDPDGSGRTRSRKIRREGEIRIDQTGRDLDGSGIG